MSNAMFISLIRGNRVTNYLGLFAERVQFGKDYTYVQLGLGEVRNADGEVLDKCTRNQHLQLIPDEQFKPHQLYKVMVVTNPALQQVANVPAVYFIDGADPTQKLEIWASFRKDLDPSTLGWLVRLYLVQ